VSDLVGLPAVLGNDADVAGLAEALHGAGKGLSPIFYITIGSGIGGGLIIDGEIYRGCGRGAAEVGQLRVVDSPTWGTRGMVPLERLASGWAIGTIASELLQRPMTATQVGQSAARGEAGACSALRCALIALAEGICHVIALLCPRRIVIGGGVSLMGQELLFTPLRRLVADRVFAPFAGLTDIVPAALGEEVVVHGAVTLARKRLST
jgi:glucokinase